MRDQRSGRAGSWTGLGTWWVSVVVALAVLGGPLVLAQNPPAKGKTARTHGKDKKEKNAKKAIAADPLANAPGLKEGDAGGLAAGTFHYKFRLAGFDNTQLSAAYYPARLGTSAPVILMVHEKDRSGKDFEEPIADLKGVGLAEHMQSQGYAVLTLDLRNQGLNQQRPLGADDWRQMTFDLQAAYTFLLDRHNRGELNLAKLGVLGVGEGANLAAAWAYQPGGAVSSEGRTGDIAAMVLVSPLGEGEKLPLVQVVASLAPRIPLFLLVGERDLVSSDPVKAARPVVERSRLGKVELFKSSLHGYKLLRLEPRVTSSIARFFEGMIKFKAVEWEPRYNLNPVSFSDIQVVRNAKPATGTAKARDKALVPAPPPEAKDAGKAKAKAKADDKGERD